MVLEHTAKIGMILGLNLQFASKENYEEEIYKKIKYDERIVEIRKDITFKKDYKSQCIIIIAILAE